jgi:hypothetical protein
LARQAGVNPGLFLPKSMGTREPVVYTSPSLATIEEVDVPSRLKTIEPGLTVAEPPYYTGDVANAINDM